MSDWRTDLPEWQDDTSYRSRAKSEQPVQVLLLKQDGMQLIVHRLHQLPGWYMSLRDYGVTLVQDRLLTEKDDLEAAKTIALEEAIDTLATRIERCKRFIDGVKSHDDDD